jgi:hypothetical protein
MDYMKKHCSDVRTSDTYDRDLGVFPLDVVPRESGNSGLRAARTQVDSRICGMTPMRFPAFPASPGDTGAREAAGIALLKDERQQDLFPR